MLKNKKETTKSIKSYLLQLIDLMAMFKLEYL